MKKLLTCLTTLAFVINGQAAHIASINATSPTLSLAGAESTLTLSKQVKLKSHTVLTKLQQVYHGVPVFGFHVVKTSKNNGLSSYQGSLLTDISGDVPTVNAEVNKENAINALRKLTGVKKHKISNEKASLQIYMDRDQNATLAYYVSFFVRGANPSRPTGFINATTGEVISHWEGLTTKNATGPGGNEKTGQYFYGTDFDSLIVTDDCKMSSDNVDTVDLKHGTSGGAVHVINPCTEIPDNTYKAINGAYSPINDGHSFGNVVFNMYKDWYDTAPLLFKLKVRLHYSNSFENAFWNGREMTFGDGKDHFYPLVSLDVMSHEVSHGFTEQQSGLIYQNQSGGINEAFSDIAGEAAEYYINQKPDGNDWLVGADIFKGDSGTALRYFENPEKDGHSISHADKFVFGMNVHYSSGVFNRAFYLLANTSGWDVHKAFDVFVLANQIYWHPAANYDSAACGVSKATTDLGYRNQDVTKAFAAVGVNATCEVVEEATDIASGEVIENIKDKKGGRHYFRVVVPSHMSLLKVKAYGGKGDSDLYILKDGLPELQKFDCRGFKKGRAQETCEIKEPKPGRYYIMLHAYKRYSKRKLKATVTA